MSFTPRITRFRAYQVGTAGSSFSYFADNKFRLIEARLTDHSKASLEAEMIACGVDRAHSLEITSWDMDHCSATELPGLLAMVRPRNIELPGYAPHSATAREAREIIRRYRASQNEIVVGLQDITPAYIGGLEAASEAAFRNIFYHPTYLDSVSNNNNSTVKLYRDGSFNVLSLGDVACPQLSASLRERKILKSETDVMILAHHGADNGFTTKKFLERLRPTLTICTSDFDNKFEHPKQEIKDLLFEQGIPIWTTKTGDVVIRSIAGHTGSYEAINLIARSTEVSSKKSFRAKKAAILGHNEDTIRQLYAPTPAHRRLR